MSIYGVNTWALSTYEARRSIISNYINPIIGDMKLSDVNTRAIDKYYQGLLKVKSVSTQNRKPNNEYCSVHVVREVDKVGDDFQEPLLKCHSPQGGSYTPSDLGCRYAFQSD